jgi:hypothetical protein
MKVYNGSSWDLVAPDTTNFIQKTLLTAKGAIIAASGASTPAELTVATTNGYVLSVNSATATGLEWAAPNPGDITSVVAGTGLTGGATSGAATVSLDTSSVYVVPSQATHSGKYLTTNGTTSSWGTIQAGSQVKIDGGAASTYDFIDFDGMGTSTATTGTVIVSPITVTDADPGKRIYVGTTTPSSSETGDIWIDESSETDPDLRTMTLMGAY